MGYFCSKLFSVGNIEAKKRSIECFLTNVISTILGENKETLVDWQPPNVNIWDFQDTLELSSVISEQNINSSSWRHNHDAALVFLTKEQGLTPEQAINELNELNSLQADTLVKLFEYGIRGEHLRNIAYDISETYPERNSDHHRITLDTLQQKIIVENKSIAESIIATKDRNNYDCLFIFAGMW